MGSVKLSCALICFFSLSILHSIHAQNSPQDYVNAHNTPRGQVGVGNVVWNVTVANYAQNYANQRINDCSLVGSAGPYGENLVAASGITGTNAVNIWVGQKPYYDHTSNSCIGGHACAQYTQVVWTNSVQIGCARVQCTNNGWWFVICSYYERGNIAGQSPY